MALPILMPPPRQRFVDNLGLPLVNGMVYTFAAGTSDQLATFQDATGTVPHQNPIRLDERGEATIYWLGNYRINLRNAIGVQIPGYPVDNFNAADLDSLISSGVGSLNGPTGASKVGLPTGQTVETKLSESLSNLDFILTPADRLEVVAGTSTKDFTSQMQAAIDAAGSTKRLHWYGTVNTKALSSTASVDWIFEGGAKIKQIPGTYTAGSFHVSLTGPRVRVENLEMDGNQDAMVSGQGSNGLLVSGVSPTLLRGTTHDYNGRGADINSASVGVKRGLVMGCSFDDNAGLGLMTTAASYLDFTNCTTDRNGYGFQKTRTNYADTSHGFVAFGAAIRLRSHHITFTAHQARDNGRDGLNINQGSYAIKHISCLAYGNDDGGFTIASDNTGTGLPGESEACYDLEYIGCEAYNNYSSGLAAYQPVHNLKVSGGRYYNNHRLAGNQAAASSYYNGIYIANGSTGYDIDTNCYDDRIFATVSSNSAGVLNVPGWKAGTMNYYPKVALYRGTDGVFKGYGKITAEAANSVTIAATTVDGVTIGGIVAGDYITQAVQHNGVFADNNTQGALAVMGAGHRAGAQGTTGFNMYSAGFTFGQNVILPKERISSVELLVNPSFETDTSGWTFSLPGGGTQTFHTGANRRSAGSLQLTAGSAQADADGAIVSGGLQATLGQFVDIGVWVYAALRNDATFTLIWLIGASTFVTNVTHPGGGWRYLRIGALIPGNATAVFPRYSVPAGRTAWFDSGKFRTVDQGMDPREIGMISRFLPY